MKKLVWDVYIYESGARDVTPFALGLTKSERRKMIVKAKNEMKSLKKSGLVVTYVDNVFYSSY